MTSATVFSLGDIKKVDPISGWEEFWQDGNAFLKTASAAYTGNKKAFTPEILYNLIAMAIEKFVMTALMHQGTMPYNHTMLDLVEAMEDTFPGGLADIKDGLLNLDKYQEICDLEGFSITPPDMSEIPNMLELANRLHLLVHNTLKTH